MWYADSRNTGFITIAARYQVDGNDAVIGTGVVATLSRNADRVRPGRGGLGRISKWILSDVRAPLTLSIQLLEHTTELHDKNYTESKGRIIYYREKFMKSIEFNIQIMFIFIFFSRKIFKSY